MRFLTPPLPKIDDLTSPAITSAFDEVRSVHDADGEFYWFAREYPRHFRYQVSHVRYRLRNIHARYLTLERQIAADKEYSDPQVLVGTSISNPTVVQIYWEFEAFLNALNTALEFIARILTTTSRDHAPISFNKLCAKGDLNGPVAILRACKADWVDRMKDYRDCFVHFTPVDSMLVVDFAVSGEDVTPRVRIPSNPNIREPMGFRFSRRGDVLRYAIRLYRKLELLDQRLATSIRVEFKEGRFPARTENLHFVAPRMHK